VSDAGNGDPVGTGVQEMPFENPAFHRLPFLLKNAGPMNRAEKKRELF
jgi:hypothetical protein